MAILVTCTSKYEEELIKIEGARVATTQSFFFFFFFFFLNLC